MGATAQHFPPFTTVQYHFYRMRDNGWDDQFDTDRNADAAFQSALAAEGFEVFLDKN
jgi:hypothetical protein